MITQDTWTDGQRAPRARYDDSLAATNGGGPSDEALAKGLGWFSIALGALELGAPGAVADWLGIEANEPLIRSFGARDVASGIGILAQERPVGWMWGRVAGDILDLAAIATTVPGSGRRGRVAASAGFVAGVLALDLLAANRLSRLPGARRADLASSGTLRVRKLVAIAADPDTVYAFWRRLENLPAFMQHVQRVVESGRRSHWVAKTAGIKVEWDAEIVEDVPGSRLAWRSIEGAMLHHAGVVRFEPADPRPGTIVDLDMEIRLPLGLMPAFSKLFGKTPERQIGEDLRSLKQLLETGEVATTAGQSSGRRARRRESRGDEWNRRFPGAARGGIGRTADGWNSGGLPE